MRLGIGQIHRGVGQAGCFAGGFAQNMQEWLAGIQLPGPDAQLVAAVGCGPGASQPCASPADAANQALAIAKSWCDESNAQSWMGCPSDPNCGDGGAAAAAPYVAQALAIFSRFPASTWTTAAADAASGNYYGTQNSYGAPVCPPGTFFNTKAGGGFTCTPPDATPQQFTGDSGPKVNPLTGQPVPSTITPSNSPTNAAPASTQPAAGTSTPAAGTGSGGTSNTSTTSDPLAWLTETSIGTVPNWMLLAGGLVAIMVLPSLLKGGR